eukprot:15338667-Heterocapsa_arctica.AAC.1
MIPTVHADISAILVVSVVEEDVMVAGFPGPLLPPFRELGFVPDFMVFRAALPGKTDFAPARRLCEGPN